MFPFLVAFFLFFYNSCKNEERSIQINSVSSTQRTIELIGRLKHTDFVLFKNFNAWARMVDDENRWIANCRFKIDNFYFELVPLRIPINRGDTSLVSKIKKMADVQSISYDSAYKKIEDYLSVRKKFYDELGYSRIDGWQDTTYIYVGDYSIEPRKGFIVLIDTISEPTNKRVFEKYISIGKKVYDRFYIF